MKILILENSIVNEIAMKAGISQAVNLCASVGLALNVTYQTIDKTFTSIPISSDVVKSGFSVNPQEILPYGAGYDVVCLISNWTRVQPNNWSINNPINPCTFDLDKTTLKNTIVMQITEEWYNDYPEVLCSFFLHELSHALYDITGILPDLTHQKYATNLWSQKSDNDYYLSLIKGLNVPTSPTATLTRHNGGNETFGDFKASTGTTTLNCYSLELPWKNNQANISCIPTGTYTVKWTITPKFPNGVYQLQNVPNRDGVDIHAGSFATGEQIDTDGCILLGSQYNDLDNNTEEDLINSQKTLDKFQTFMEKKDFTLIIK